MTLFFAALVVFALSIIIAGLSMMRQDKQLFFDLAESPSTKHADLLTTYIRRQRWQPLLLAGMTGVILLSLHAYQLFAAPKPQATVVAAAQKPESFEELWETEAPTTDDILNLYDPSPPKEEPEAMKIRHEQTATAVLILEQCGLISREQLLEWQRSLYETLIAEPQGEALYHSVISAASGSYELFYHRTPCDSAPLQILLKEFKQRS